MSKRANADLSDMKKTQMQMLEAGALLQCGCRSYKINSNGNVQLEPQYFNISSKVLYICIKKIKMEL